MLEEIQEDNELRKESSNLDNQIERLKKATEEVNKACESLDTKMESARSDGATVAKAGIRKTREEFFYHDRTRHHQ